MDAQAFWNVIGNYNQQTKNVQIILFVILGIALWNGTYSKVFALPLYFVCGILFLCKCYHSRDDRLEKPNLCQVSLLVLYLLYPLISVMLGNNYPQMVLEANLQMWVDAEDSLEIW